MTLDELQADIWAELPKVPRTLGGRRMADRIVSRAVYGWPVAVLEQCNAEHTEEVAREYTKSMGRRMRHELGMGIILTLVLSALISEIVKALVKRWMANREGMRALVCEMRHHD